ncbi:MAG: phage terminase large subunit family protein [Aeromonas veronii]
MAPYDGSLTPYMDEVMDTLKSRRYDATAFCGPARTGKTVSIVDGWTMDTVARNKADMLIVSVSQEKAAEHRKRRLQRAFDACPEVKAALSPLRSDNNIHDIRLRSGAFLKIAWPSKNVFSSSDWKYVALTDLDRMPLNVDGEGSPFLLASKRTQTFMSSGHVLAESSPGHAVTDLNYRPTGHEAPPCPGILGIYNQGDRRLFYWQCAEGCGEWFEPTFDLLQYDKDETDPAKAGRDVYLACPHCGEIYRENQRVRGQAYKIHANRSGLWVPEGCHIDQNGQLQGERRETRIASFWLRGGLAAAFQTWNSLVSKHTAAMQLYLATGSHEELKAVVNTDLGLPYIPPSVSDRDAGILEARKEDLGVKVVPPWVRFLIATIDVQGGAKTRRFEVQVHGVGKGLEMAIIDRFKIEKSERKDPDNPDKFVRVKPGTYPEDWDLLINKVIKKRYPIDDGSGRTMGVYRTGCDSNGEDGVTDQAYGFWRRLKTQGLHKRFILIKGHSRPGSGLIEVKHPDNTKRADRKTKVAGEVPVLFIQSNLVKDIASASLDRDIAGPRYVHFANWLPRSLYDELMAEVRLPDGKWDKVSPRNEAFDLICYAWAILHFIKAHKIMDWERPPAFALPLDENPEVFAGEGEDDAPVLLKRRRRRSS